jgi:hypothetical protein
MILRTVAGFFTLGFLAIFAQGDTVRIVTPLA